MMEILKITEWRNEKMRDAFGGEVAMQTLGGMDRQVPVEQRLAERKQNHVEEIAKIDKALELLKAQPQLLETLNVLRSVGI